MKKRPIPRQLQEKIEGFDKQCEEAVHDFVRKYADKKCPEFIYHYTDDIGLKAIIQEKTIRLTDVFSLNDPSEVEYFTKEAFKILKSKCNDIDARDLADEFERFANGGAKAVAHYFVACFSKAPDELGQWRAYANNGKGFALKFDARKLEECFIKQSLQNPNVFGHSTFHLTYNKRTMQALLRALIKGVPRLIQRMPSSAENLESKKAFYDHLLTSLYLQCVRSGLFFKHAGYKNEEEYRFLKLYKHDSQLHGLKRRYRQNEVVKFMDFNWSDAADSLRSVVIGPAADKVVSRRFVEDCLNQHFPIGQVTVDVSDIPYRSL